MVEGEEEHEGDLRTRVALVVVVVEQQQLKEEEEKKKQELLFVLVATIFAFCVCSVLFCLGSLHHLPLLLVPLPFVLLFVFFSSLDFLSMIEQQQQQEEEEEEEEEELELKQEKEGHRPEWKEKKLMSVLVVLLLEAA